MNPPIRIEKSRHIATFRALSQSLKGFEQRLESGKDIGISFSGGPTMHLISVAFVSESADLVFFDVATLEGVRCEVYQHATQINLTLMQIDLFNSSAERKPIGFHTV